MPRPTNRQEILGRLRKVIADGGVIVGAGAGTLPLSDNIDIAMSRS